MALRAVVFDFDGTLVDTETSAYESISSVYADHGQKLELETWAVCIGTLGGFDPHADLQRRTGKTLNKDELYKLHRARHAERLQNATLRPGVLERLAEAHSLGWKIGLASSSDRAWIEKHLGKQGIRDRFEVICSSDDVKRVKPDPELYIRAVEALGVRPGEALAIEDSMNGLRAAKAAGLWGLAIPNPVTAQMNFSEADVLVDSLDRTTFAQIEATLQSRIAQK
ncbi:HAD family hydrolase [Cohnella soli]|uniref:HAD family hydrolase n=1 Tax=Cohnella soli TaxID=425005 RepID=A0ABW0HTG3_9BACL